MGNIHCLSKQKYILFSKHPRSQYNPSDYIAITLLKWCFGYMKINREKYTQGNILKLIFARQSWSLTQSSKRWDANRDYIADAPGPKCNFSNMW